MGSIYLLAFIRIFASRFMRDIDLQISLLVMMLSCFSIRVILTS